ncbi:MAG: CDC27 family protein, partial [Planctomycetota bacterium]|nr:CDC27 family protein [Planctomycetota bacterium]
KRINSEKLILKRQQKELKKQNQVYELINTAEGIAKRAGPKNEVLQLVEKALALSGHSETAYISAARVFETRLLWQEGIEILKEGVKRNPPGYDIYFRIYLLESKRERWLTNEVAVRGGHESLKLESETFLEMSKVVDGSGQENEFTLYSSAQRAMKNGDFREALTLLNKAEARNKNMAAIYVQRSQVQLQLNNPREAVRDLQRSLVIKPQLISWFRMGQIYFRNKQYRNAYNALERCVQDQTSLRHQALFMMAQISTEEKNYDDAISLLTRAIKDQAINLTYRERRASLLFYKNYFKDCIRDYSVILAVKPKHVESLYWRGACYFSINLREKGLIDYKKALALDPNNIAARSIPMQFPWLKDALK